MWTSKLSHAHMRARVRRQDSESERKVGQATIHVKILDTLIWLK